MPPKRFEINGHAQGFRKPNQKMWKKDKPFGMTFKILKNL